MGLLADLGFAHLSRRPDLTRLLTDYLRRNRPLPGLGKTILVLRDDDVREVLTRDEDFELGAPNARKMLWGPFLLGMDPSPQYAQDKRILQQALTEARPHFEELVERTCETIATDLWDRLPSGRPIALEVVDAYAERITTQAAADFYGVRVEGAESKVVRGDAFDVFRQWLRKLGSVIAATRPAPFGLQSIAEICADEFSQHVERTIREREAEIAAHPAAAGQSVLDQLLVDRSPAAPRLDVHDLVRNLIGLMVAGSGAITRSFVHVLDQLLRRPGVLDQAIAAARHADLVTLGELADEAMRFNPTFPVLPRFSPRATTLAAGTARQREIPAGTTLYVIISSAMFDGESLHQPEIFRPARKYEHLHFGTGIHECIGAPFARFELATMLRCFLERPRALELRRGWGRRARIHYDGITIDRYEVQVYV